MFKVSIRLMKEDLQNIDSFAVVRKMSRSAATEFFVMEGIKAHTRLVAENELKEEVISLKNALKSMHEALYASTMYSNMALPTDVEKFTKAKEKATVSANQIFDQE